MNDSNSRYQDAVKSLANSIKYMIEQYMGQTTKIYTGQLTAYNGSVGTISMNGRTYTINQYGGLTHNAGDIVKVFIPEGNMNTAFFI